MKKAVQLIEAAFIIFFSLPLAFLPLRLALKAGESLGLFVFYVWGSRRRIAIDNLRSVSSLLSLNASETPENIIRENFKNLGRSLVEIIKIYFGLSRPVVGSVTIEGEDNFWTAREKNKGVIFITGHCGNWELLALTSSVRIRDLSIVVRPVDNLFLNRLVENARRRHGNKVINKKGALKPVIQTLKKNGTVGILMDQAVLPEEGLVIDFLGKGAWTTKMPALIARKTGAAVLPAFIHRDGKGHVLTIYPEIELSKKDDTEEAVREDTINFSRSIEEYIKAHPSEWLWIQEMEEGSSY